MAGWYHRLNGHEFGWTLKVGDGQDGVPQFAGSQRVGHNLATKSPPPEPLLQFITYSILEFLFYSVSSVTQSCLTFWDPMNHSTPGLPVHHQLLEFTQTHVHWVGDAIQPSHPVSSPSPPSPVPPIIRFFSSESTLLMRWPLEFKPQHQSFQWTPRTTPF